MPHLEQVEPGGRHLAHVRLLGLLVPVLVEPVLPLAQELRPGLLGLADEDDVGQALEVVFLDRHQRPADDGEDPASLQLGEDLLHPEPLDAHAGHADDVGPGAALVVDRLDVLVDQGDGVLLRA